MTIRPVRNTTLRFAVAVACTLVPVIARADSAEAEARATKLFEEGRSFARDGRCSEAIPLFLLSVKESAGIGALLNLGHCYEETGKTLSAYRSFVRAAEMARARDDSRAKEAQDRARAIEPRLSDLTVRVSDLSEPSLTLWLDDEPLDRSRWGVPTRVDPGPHVVAAVSPRRGTVSLRITVGANAHAELVVPPLATRAAPEGRDEPSPGGSQRAIGWAIGATGAGAVVVGAVFGVLSAVDHGSLVDRCPTYPTCPEMSRSDLDDLNDRAKGKGNVATISIALGLGLIVGGAALVLLAPRGRANLGWQ